MDVKDVSIGVVPAETLLAERSTPISSTTPNNAADDSAVKVDTRKADRANAIRQSANDVVTIINVAVDATEEIDRLVKSISGIVDQASKTNVPEKRLVALQSEANQLIDAIKKKAFNAKTGDVNPLAGDPIKLDAEQEIGKKVEVNLPGGAEHAFGLGKIDFSNHGNLPEVRGAVTQAQKQLETLKHAVGSTKEAVHSAVNELDVALQNSEASHTSVRDLDEALKIAGRAKAGITFNPQGALASVSRLSSKSLGLLD